MTVSCIFVYMSSISSSDRGGQHNFEMVREKMCGDDVRGKARGVIQLLDNITRDRHDYGPFRDKSRFTVGSLDRFLVDVVVCGERRFILK